MSQTHGQSTLVTHHVPVYNIGRFDRITDKRSGEHYSWIDTGVSDYQFQRMSDKLYNRVTHSQLNDDLTNGLIEIETDYFLAQKPEIRNIFQNQSLMAIPEHKMERAHFYADLFNAFIRRKALKPRGTSLSTPCLETLMPVLAEEIAPIWTRGKARPGPNSTTTIKLPSARHFRRLFKCYVESGYQLASLIDRYGSQRTRTSKALPEETQLYLEFAMKYAQPSKPSMAVIYRALEAKIADLNIQRDQNQLSLLKTPSRKTFEKIIQSLDPFEVTLKREGRGAAEQKFRITAQGVDVTRPGERVEIDEWKVDLMTLLTWLRIAEKLTSEERKAVKRARLWLTVAIDCATRCILAMRFTTKEPSSESSMAALEMILMDKSELSMTAGAKSSWFQTCRPETVVTDNGAAFIATPFRTALADLRITHMLPPAGVSRLRPFIESFFKTSTGFLSWYEGRTFSNYLEKGDTDPEKDACVCVDQLNRDFILAIVDIYHNTPHSGLAGETPRNAWLRLSRIYGVQPQPNPDQRRRIFGINCLRRITDKGVRILGLHYQSRELQQIRVHTNTKEVEVRFDRFDLSRVSVKAGNTWLDVSNRYGLSSGVSIWEWVTTARQLASIHAENANITRAVMLDAINGMRESGEALTARAELGVPILTEKHINHIERTLFQNLRILENDYGQNTELSAPTYPFDPLRNGPDPLTGTFDTDEELNGSYTIDAPVIGERGQYGNASDVTFE